MVEQQKQENTESNFSQNNQWWKPAMFFYAKVTSWIILPLAIALFLGKYARESLGSQVWFFIAVILGFLITCFGIYREIKTYQKEVNK